MEWYRNLQIVQSTEDKLPFLEQPIPALPVLAEGQVIPSDIVTMHQDWVKAQKSGTFSDVRRIPPSTNKRTGSLFLLALSSQHEELYRQIWNQFLVIAVTQNLFVSLILVSLRKEYDGFVQNYNMHNMGKTVTELHAMLKLHDQTLPPKEVPPTLHAIRA
ncbi:hypothetical protein Tco_0871946 [Tanacetum coccineum]